MANHYETLNIKSTATPQEIKSKFRSLVKELRPDLGQNAEEFQRIMKAYDVLGDPVRRSKYDKLTLVVAADEADKKQRIEDDPWSAPKGFTNVPQSSSRSIYFGGVWNLPQGAPMPFVPMGTAYPHSSGSSQRRKQTFSFSILYGQPGSALDVGDTAWIDNRGGLSLVNSGNYQEVVVIGRSVSSSGGLNTPTIHLVLEDLPYAAFANRVMASGSPANFQPTPAQQAFFGQTINVNISTQSSAANPSLTMADVQATINKLSGSMAQAFAPWTGQKYEIEVPYTRDADSFHTGDELWLTQSGIQTNFSPKSQRVKVTDKIVNLRTPYGTPYSITFTLEDFPQSGITRSQPIPISVSKKIAKDQYGRDVVAYRAITPYDKHNSAFMNSNSPVYLIWDTTGVAVIERDIPQGYPGNWTVIKVFVRAARSSFSAGFPTEIEFDLEEVPAQQAAAPLPDNLQLDKLRTVYTITIPPNPVNRRLVNHHGGIWLVWHTGVKANQPYVSSASLSFLEILDPAGGITCIKVNTRAFRVKIDKGQPVSIEADLLIV